jgi:hypothetical protein
MRSGLAGVAASYELWPSAGSSSSAVVVDTVSARWQQSHSNVQAPCVLEITSFERLGRLYRGRKLAWRCCHSSHLNFVLM